MKKVALSLAGVLAAAAFAPEASALPVFARQTGAACSACHFQHFPLLNAFGRSFKSSGYTQISQAQVEGEHLSIPTTLNFGALVTAGVENATGNSSNIFVPGTGGEMQLFWGGRINDFAGFLSEFGTAAPAGAAGGKMLILPEIAGDIRGGLVAYSIGQDAAGAFELLNTGATSIHRLMGRTGFGGGVIATPAAGGGHIEVTSARQYVAPELGATGASVVVNNPNFFVNVGKYVNVGNAVVGGTQGAGLPFMYIRAAGMFDVAGWDVAAGVQNWSGTTNNPALGAIGAIVAQKATVVDAQAQGEVAGLPVGIYASYGRSAASNAVETNQFNAALGTRTSFNTAVEVGVIPGHATVQAAFRIGNNGTPALGGDNGFMLGATYELSQNQELTFHYTTQSGSAWNAVGGVTPAGKSVYTLLLETLF
ncbi:hypothetical protein [Ferriphaselus sp. R-1]|uniref:hypothetical protein n=1 Tax=Ferriphaselus sp. R-1 TaxID=1485544 RepID=UPI00054DB491|nr:hypothetical protein [Ferriphaselus sp. R-1]